MTQTKNSHLAKAALEPYFSDPKQREALKHDISVLIANAVALGLGGGATFRALQGLLRPQYRPYTGGSAVAKVEEREKRAFDMPNPKQALIAWFDRLQRTSSKSPSWLAGDYAGKVYQSPFAWAVGVPAALGSVYLGYKGADMLADALRKRRDKAELEKLKAEYLKTLQELEKTSSAASLDKLADAVVTAMEKAASGSYLTAGRRAFEGTASSLLGLYLLYALATGAGAAHGAYNYASRRPNASIYRAVTDTRSRRHEGGVRPIQAIIVSRPQKQEEDEAA